MMISGYLPYLAQAYNRMGLACRSLSNAAAGREFSLKSLELYKQIGDPNGEAKNLSELSEDSLREGLNEESIQYLDKAISLYKRSGHKNGLGKVILHISKILFLYSIYFLYISIRLYVDWLLFNLL
jgi:hypothetical protein